VLFARKNVAKIAECQLTLCPRAVLTQYKAKILKSCLIWQRCTESFSLCLSLFLDKKFPVWGLHLYKVEDFWATVLVNNLFSFVLLHFGLFLVKIGGYFTF
jgi:hypothetical protein